MADVKHTIVLRRFNGTSFDIAFPKTIASQIDTIKTHLDNAITHLSADDRNAIGKFAILNTDGKLSATTVKKDLVAINKEYANTAAMVADFANITAHTVVMVLDATDDTTVKSGWAIYRKVGTEVNLTSFTKISESESLDVRYAINEIDLSKETRSGDFTYDGKMFDDLVAASHTHENASLVNKIDETMLRASAVTDNIKYDKNDTYPTGTMIFLKNDTSSSGGTTPTPSGDSPVIAAKNATIDLYGTLPTANVTALHTITNPNNAFEMKLGTSKTDTYEIYDTWSKTVLQVGIVNDTANNSMKLVVTKDSGDSPNKLSWHQDNTSNVIPYGYGLRTWHGDIQVPYTLTKKSDGTVVDSGNLAISIANSEWADEFVIYKPVESAMTLANDSEYYAAHYKWTDAEFHGDWSAFTEETKITKLYQIPGKRVYMWALGGTQFKTSNYYVPGEFDWPVASAKYIPDDTEVAFGMPYTPYQQDFGEKAVATFNPDTGVIDFVGMSGIPTAIVVRIDRTDKPHHNDL